MFTYLAHVCLWFLSLLSFHVALQRCLRLCMSAVRREAKALHSMNSKLCCWFVFCLRKVQSLLFSCDSEKVKKYFISCFVLFSHHRRRYRRQRVSCSLVKFQQQYSVKTTPWISIFLERKIFLAEWSYHFYHASALKWLSKKHFVLFLLIKSDDERLEVH